ncbi:MAG: aspartate 1-decarboxylase [bacterium]|jgi:aspartate 1-decarboxylase
MLLSVLKSKIHLCTLTGADIEYEGSIGISRELLDAAEILPYEEVLVANVRDGARLTTYAIPLDEPGQIVLNGAAAHYGKPGDKLIIMTFAKAEPEEARKIVPKVIKPGPDNRVRSDRN